MQVIFYGMNAPHARKVNLMRFSKTKRWTPLGGGETMKARTFMITNGLLVYGKSPGVIDVLKSLNLNRKVIFLIAQLQKNVELKILNA